MAENVFASPYNQAPQIWQTQGAKIMCNAVTVTCLTGLRAQLARQIQDRYPLGGGGIIRLVGQPQGQLDITSLLGPTGDVITFLKSVSNICNPVTISVQPFALSSLSCGKASNQKWTFINCTAMTTGIDIQQAQGGMSLVSVPISIRFDNIQV